MPRSTAISDEQVEQYIRRWLGHCEECGAIEGVELVKAMTAYHYEGKLGTIDDPNRQMTLCAKCADEYHDYWSNQWDEYISSQG